MIKWNYLPKEIQEEMLKQQVLQGNARNESVFMKNIRADKDNGGFFWELTKQGYVHWKNILVLGIFTSISNRVIKTINTNIGKANIAVVDGEFKRITITKCDKSKLNKFVNFIIEYDELF